ncbi:hypothetical protein BKA61DRAFT_320787 [Leptodontidium sp. MPI-SDFR-AT-0119]|nr:hypothetical protein BKA61DRAFT_320787 [Leptodontidium sp. MPI-SDFR-AT-0119]
MSIIQIIFLLGSELAVTSQPVEAAIEPFTIDFPSWRHPSTLWSFQTNSHQQVLLEKGTPRDGMRVSIIIHGDHCPIVNA